MNLQWGQWIIEKLQTMSGKGKYIMIIRHSERQDFSGIPIDMWNSVGLTERGIQAAFDFGKSLISDSGLDSVRTEGWGLQRCIDTAVKIAEGVSDAGRSDCDSSIASDLESPIADYEKYHEYLSSGRWNELLKEWLSSPADGGAMKPFRNYSSSILNEILLKHTPGTNCGNVIVTHDLHIFPLIAASFGTVKLDIDFMDGVLISRNGDSANIFHRDMTSNISLDL